MRLIGTQATSLRLPIISKGNDLPNIIADVLDRLIKENNFQLNENSILGVTEAIVAKSQGNYATIYDIENSVREHFEDEEVAVVFPILSRNRFSHILKGISLATKKVHLLLDYPFDEVGNPIMDVSILDDVNLDKEIFTADEFEKITGKYYHPFTNVNYIDLYKEVNDNIEIYISKKPQNILDICKNVIVADVHNRFTTKKRLKKAGAKKIITLDNILSEPVNNSGYNPEFGLIGSNLSTDDSLKLFPRHSEEFAYKTQEAIFKKTSHKIEVMVYGDGAFKDPVHGIWEFDDPAVSPGYTKGLAGSPNEIKLKYLADNQLSEYSNEEKEKRLKQIIADKKENEDILNVGTTPRRYVDLIGSLCDLMSGSGDKGTPIVLIQGYFDDYSDS